MLAVLLAVTPSPSPSARFDQNAITPGVVGFLAIFLVTAATILLIIDMTRRVRRVRYRGELAERRAAAEQNAQEPPPE